MKKRQFFYFILILLLIAFFELGAYLVVRLYLEHKNPHALFENRQRFESAISDSQINSFYKRKYHQRLGWVNKTTSTPSTRKNSLGETWTFSIDAKGARVNPYNSGSTFISAYGDSFTFGAEVNSNQTWVYFLSEKTGSNVLNFGVSGYGTDQALLRIKYNRENSQDNSKIVILAVLSENLNRTMCMCRAFYNYNKYAALSFKPMFHLVNDEFVLLPNPLKDTAAGSRASFWQALTEAKKHDFWYRRNKKYFKFHFPYTFTLSRFLYHLAASEEVRDMYNAKTNHHINLYNNETAVKKLKYIIDVFVALSEENDFFPVVVFIPVAAEMRNFLKTRSYSYKDFVAAILRHNPSKRLLVIDIMEMDFDCNKFYLHHLKGHCSEYGNKTIADAIYSRIKPLLQNHLDSIGINK